MSVPRWEGYRDLFSIAIFRYLVTWFSLVPIVVLLLKDVPEQVALEYNGQEILVNMALPFSWQWLWFSSLSFVIAMILYSLLCPSLIKKYHSYSDYKARLHDKRWLVHEAMPLLAGSGTAARGFIERLVTKKFVEAVGELPEGEKLGVRTIAVDVSRVHFENSDQIYVLQLPLPKDETDEARGITEKGIFWEIYGTYSGGKFVARLLILLLLIVSGSIFSGVLIQHIFAGFLYASAIF
ncbi:MAG: hypothetical protein COB36_09990 [Alphaproteobacteria bacterium]|nr:MAG: hypothetical protein COB36_09990 [Alphaproteobacteria bacterium]